MLLDLDLWLPSLTTTAALAAVLWLSRNLIATRLTKSVEHEFNEKLEILRGQMRASEERLKAELRAKEAEIAALRSGALTALASRQMAIDKRRLEAVDQLWASVTALAPARPLVALMSFTKFEVAAERATREPKLRQVFEMMGAGFDAKSLDLSGAARARPFLSPMVWAVFSALVAVMMHSAMRFQVIREGIGGEGFIDNQEVLKLVKAALPHYSEYIDQHGSAVFHHVLEALDARLLTELQNMLAGVEADRASVEQAQEIMRLADSVKQSSEPQGRPDERP